MNNRHITIRLNVDHLKVVLLLILFVFVTVDICFNLVIASPNDNNKNIDRMLLNSPIQTREIQPSLPDWERENIFKQLTGKFESVAPLLQSIRNEAPIMEIFPLDFIIDYKQLDEEYAKTDGKFGISLFCKRTIQVQLENDRYLGSEANASASKNTIPRFTETAQLCVDSSTDDFIFEDHRIDLFQVNHYLDKRYDITYNRFLPFYRFYQSALNATSDDIDECLDEFDEMTTKEKALLLAAIYIFEQRLRTSTSGNQKHFRDKDLKYSSNTVADPFTQREWEDLVSLVRKNADSDEIAFDALENDGLVEEWERCLRLRALIFQRDISAYNPFFQAEWYASDWYALCRLAPVDFLYSLLLCETDEDFLKSNKPYPRRNASLKLPFPLPPGREKPVENIFIPSARFIKENNIRCDALEFYEKNLSINSAHYGGEEWNEKTTPNDALVLMREYLNTQFVFSRNHARSSHLSGFTTWVDFRSKTNISDSTYKYHSRGICDANTSAEPKTLGYIASTLLHARSLFEEQE